MGTIDFGDGTILQVSLAMVWLLTVNMIGEMEGLPIHLKMKMGTGLIDKYAY